MVTAVKTFHGGMRACVRSDGGVCLDWLKVEQGLQQGCVLSLLLFNIFLLQFYASSSRGSTRRRLFSKFVCTCRNGQRGRDQSSPWTTHVPCAVGCMLYADDACIVLRSLHGLAKMMDLIVDVCRAFGLTISGKKMETMCIPAPHTLTTPMEVQATGQRYKKRMPSRTL